MILHCFLLLRLTLQLFAGSRVERLGGVFNIEPCGWPWTTWLALKTTWLIIYGNDLGNHMVEYDYAIMNWCVKLKVKIPPCYPILLLDLSLLLFNSSHLVTLHHFNMPYFNFGQNSVKPALLLHVFSPTCCLLMSSIRVHVYVGILHVFISFCRHISTTHGFR
jgi:hypothetical protein